MSRSPLRALGGLTWKQGDSIQDGAPKTFHFQKERAVADGPIDTIEVEIYSCEKRDTSGVVDPKYPDDPGRTLPPAAKQKHGG